MSLKGYLGIDAGTQGLSVTFADEDMRVVAVGEGGYDMIAGLPEGQYEQNPADWTSALQQALADLRGRLDAIDADWQVRAIGISAQMHGEVLVGADDQALGPARLWCDARNEEEGDELTHAFGVKIPKRLTVARWLWALRNRPHLAARTAHLATPGGWLAHHLTGEWIIGIGDASGMFPIDPETHTYDRRLLARFASLAGDEAPAIERLLPTVRRAGEDGGTLQPDAARLLGLPAGIPVAPAEGDQPAAMAGSLIADAGMVSMSFGTSVCANVLSDRPFSGVHPGIDHFCAADGRPFHIAWLRNGTTFMNRIVGMFGEGAEAPGSVFDRIMPLALAAPPDCGGLLALPFLDEEPGLGVASAGLGLIGGLGNANTTPGHLARAALLATMYNLRTNVDELLRQGFTLKEMVLSGGLTRTPQFGQVLADVFRTPVSLLDSAAEGSAWGAALLAAFRAADTGKPAGWSAFLHGLARGEPTRFTPDPDGARACDAGYERHRRLLRLLPDLAQIFTPPPRGDPGGERAT